MHNDKDLDIVNVLRMYADDLHSDGGFNGYARAMSLAADEIVKLREYAKAMEEDLVATIEQRDELGADKARWFRMSEVFCQQAAEHKAMYLKVRDELAAEQQVTREGASVTPCQTCESLARAVMMDQTGAA